MVKIDRRNQACLWAAAPDECRVPQLGGQSFKPARLPTGFHPKRACSLHCEIAIKLFPGTGGRPPRLRKLFPPAVSTWPFCQQRCRRVGTSDAHAAGGFPRARGWIIELGTVVRAGEAATAKPAGDQHLSVREERGGMVGASVGHAARGSPGI